MSETILIVDFGSQYTQLIARRVRELNVYCEIHPYNHLPEHIPELKGIILSGAPAPYVMKMPPCWISNLSGGKFPYSVSVTERK